MIKPKTEKEIEIIRQACRITKDTLDEVAKHIKVGVSTKELDKIAHDYIKSRGARPSCLGYCGFPASICASINDEIVHGIPKANRKLKDGDIISIDLVVEYHGYNGDAARTYLVGNVDPSVQKLVEVTKQSFFEGIKNIKGGSFVGDISHQVQTYVEKHGYSIVRELVGHGIGREMHEDPEVPNYGVMGSGPKLKSGMVICVEPMVNMGDKHVKFLSDGWTCCTRDGLPAAHYENTILIKDDGVEILTM